MALGSESLPVNRSIPTPSAPTGLVTGVAAGLAAGALWGMVFVTPRAVAGFSSVDFTVGRYVACGLFSLLVLLGMWLRARLSGIRTHGQVLPTGRQALVALGLSVLGYTGYYLLLALAIEDAGSVLPTLIIGTIPIWMMALGKPEHLSWRGLLPGLFMTALGLAVMIGSQAHAPQQPESSTGLFWRGLGFAAVAMVFWTAFGLLNAVVLKRDPHVNSSDWANWMGVAAGLGGLLLWAVQGTAWHELTGRNSWTTFLWICAITGVGAAWVASVLWNVASRHLSPSLAGQLIVSETVFGVVYSFVWDGQWPAPAQWVACGLFVSGILASIRAHR